MRYNKTIKDNILTIENLHKDPLYVKIFIDKYCCNQCRDCQDCQYELASQAVLEYCEKHVLNLGDGNYNVVLSDSENNTIASFDIKIYIELRAEIIDLFFKKFCVDSECFPCGGRASSKGGCRELAYKDLLKDPIVIESMLTYAMLKGFFNNPVFMDYFQEALDFYKCSIIADDCNQKKYLKFFGKYNDDYDLFGKFASILMLGFYLMEELEGNESNLESIYRLCELKKCINKYGIVYEKPEEVFKKHIHKATTKPIIKSSKISIDLNNSCNKEDGICINNVLFLDHLDRLPAAIKITSLPTSGDLFISTEENGKIPVVANSRYSMPTVLNHCLLFYVPNETSNLVNPFDNFTFEVQMEEVLLDTIVHTDFSESGVIEILTNTLTKPVTDLNNVTVTGSNIGDKMVFLTNYMMKIIGGLKKENIEFIRVDNIIHSNNVEVPSLKQGTVYDMKLSKNQNLFFDGTTTFNVNDKSQNAFLFIKFSFKEKCSKYWINNSDEIPFIFYNFVSDGTCIKVGTNPIWELQSTECVLNDVSLEPIWELQSTECVLNTSAIEPTWQFESIECVEIV